ncbi:MAG: NAD(P)-binding protein [Burkholderiales bacterium]|nr:NAD(P)-binding protein [Burkholderiales bacterium]
MPVVGHVGVIGAGLAGLAAAVAATQAGAQVDIFESAPAPAPLLAHVDVVPNLLRDLVALGVGEACVRLGFPYQGFAVLDGEGRTRFEVPTRHLAGTRFPSALGMVYGTLLDVLRDAALARGARMHAGCEVRDASDGGAIVTADGQRHAVDLVVIASGTTVPALGSRPARPLPLEALPQQWCHALLPRPPALERAAWVIGTAGLKAMLVPVDTRRTGVAVLQPQSSGPPTADSLPAALAGQGRWLQSLAAQCRPDTPLQIRPVRSGVLDDPWHERGTLRIGHSAHVLPPHFGQAAAQVVEDAVVLGDLLRRRSERDELLQAFMRRRGERTRRVHAVTTQAARWNLRPQASTDLQALAEQLGPLVERPA